MRTRLLPIPATVVERRQDAHNIFTLRLQPSENSAVEFPFRPGQFNMVYLFGQGEIPISIASDPDQSDVLDHTIRIVGHLSRRLAALTEGSVVGLRGPFGSSWPVDKARKRDVIVITGGLGCAPAVSVIEYVLRRRAEYGRVEIFHGAKVPRDVIYRERFAAWQNYPNTRVHLTVDHAAVTEWPHRVGVVTRLLEDADLATDDCLVMMCGPEVMMRHAAGLLVAMGVDNERIYVSVERNMKCAVGFCGHCQLGPEFVCKDGPIFPYARIERFLNVREL